MNHYTSKNPHDIELRDFDAGRDFNDTPLENPRHHPSPLAIGADVFREKQLENRRSWRTILALAVLAGLLLVATGTISALYVTQAQRNNSSSKNNSSSSSNKPSTMTTGSWVLTTITAEPPPTMTVTTTAVTTSTIVRVRPTTETVVSTSTSTETTRRRAKTTSVTAIVTTTVWIITAEPHTSSSSSSSSSNHKPPGPHGKHGRCIPGGLYGGGELHVLDGDHYDRRMASAVEGAVRDGLGLEQHDFLHVALRSIFRCVKEKEEEEGGRDVRLFRACREEGYVRSPAGVACNGPALTTLPIVEPVTRTAVESETVTVTS